ISKQILTLSSKELTLSILFLLGTCLYFQKFSLFNELVFLSLTAVPEKTEFYSNLSAKPAFQ
ncbi:MAG: hypothetical protein Q4G10_06480, partial [Bacteroidia bacterium]|nr:hypothetical protein [Bacteroidia bacterium]